MSIEAERIVSAGIVAALQAGRKRAAERQQLLEPGRRGEIGRCLDEIA